jgi:hypothetical protein
MTGHHLEVRAIFRRQRGVRVVMARVTGLHLGRRLVFIWPAVDARRRGPSPTTRWSSRPAPRTRTLGTGEDRDAASANMHD